MLPERLIHPQSDQYEDACREILRVLNDVGEMTARELAIDLSVRTQSVVAKLKYLRDRGCVTYRTVDQWGGVWTIAQTESD